MPWLGNGKCEDAFSHPADFVTTPAFAMICFVFSAATNLSAENSTERDADGATVASGAKIPYVS